MAATVADLSALVVAGGRAPLRLTASQERGLAALRIAGRRGRPRAERRGRPRTWDEARVERELREFLDGRATWPTRAEFADAGRLAPYSAASRAGGIARWRRVRGR